MKYYENGNLYQYLDRHKGILPWRDIVDILWGIAGGLEEIHAEGKVHRNLHRGNLFIILIEDKKDARIGDIDLHGPCYNKSSNQIYGVLPYVVLEVLCGENHSTTSDIYSFGIIMNVLVTGKKPWYDRAHDISLAKDICDGKRLKIPEDTPKFYAVLMRQCWNNEPEKRPTASHLYKKFNCTNINLFDNEFSVSEDKRHITISQLPKTYMVYSSRNIFRNVLYK